MNTEIAGKLAVITGASAGLGKHIAHAFAAEGAHIALFARSENALKNVALDIRTRYFVRTLAIPGDMRSVYDVDRLTATIRSEFGGADILVVNTRRPPVPLREALDETDDERWNDA